MIEPWKKSEIFVGKKMDLNKGVFHKDLLSDHEQAKLLVKTNTPSTHKHTDKFGPYNQDQRKKPERKPERKKSEFSLFPPEAPAIERTPPAAPRQRYHD